MNKAAYAFCLGAMANGVYGPYAIFASVKMVWHLPYRFHDARTAPV